VRLLAVLALAACADAPTDYTRCGGDRASFVREAFLALDGRRPVSRDEVDVYVDLYAAAEARGLDGKDAVARAIMTRPEFAERWIDVVMDALAVPRSDVQSQAACWGVSARGSATPELAAAIRDHAPRDGIGAPWTMLDLARSAIALDDLSPIYRAQPFALVARPIPANNVGALETELARRADFGSTFDAAFLHRNITCLGCHTSAHSVTDSDDPASDRFWPVPGLPDQAVYGDPIDADRAHAPFRYAGIVGGPEHPWGWSAACGEFATVAPAGATVYDVEAALARGFAKLRGHPPQGAIDDRDVALAWLVALAVSEAAWTQVTGTRLTIAHGFPRNQAASDLLDALASRFVTSGYSLRALLVAIVESAYFDVRPATDACGAPDGYPDVFDPWERGNGPGDAIAPVDARTLVTAANAALGWSPPPAATRFPDYGDVGCELAACSQMRTSCADSGACCNAYTAACEAGGRLPAVELPFERSVGMFLRASERGFRGLDVQARLVWEDRYGACERPAWVDADIIDALAASGGTMRDATAALKDRVIGESTIAAGPETDALAAIADLDGAIDPGGLRTVCGALLGSPQFLMSGMPGRGGAAPRLTPAAARYDAVCADLATRFPVRCTPKLALQ
jgi:hypothetical protein